MPSLLITLLSIFKIAPLIVRAVGKTVRPILIAFERFGSSTVISFFTSPPFYIKQKKKILIFESNIIRKNYPKKREDKKDKKRIDKAHSHRIKQQISYKNYPNVSYLQTQ
jgi:hypothetical protein